MVSVNRKIRDKEIDHAVNLRAYTTNVVNRMIATLNRSDAALFTQLIDKLSYMDPERFTVQRLEEMLQSTIALNNQAYAVLNDDLSLELRQLNEFEVRFQQGMLAETLPPAFPVAKVNVDQVYAAAMSRPFQGGLLKEFLKDQASWKATLIRRTIADGFVQARTTDQIVRDLRGTRSKGYADGILESTRRDAAAVVRTAISHTAEFAKQKVFSANADLGRGYQWVSTLDTRTTPECQVRDGMEYDMDFKPVGHNYPWGAGPGALHWQCRSTRVMLTKSWRQLGVDVDEFSAAERASMDGTVPEKTTYEDWLKDQSKARQNEVLGATRAEQFREGNLSLRDLYSAQGEELTLAELRNKYPNYFE